MGRVNFKNKMIDDLGNVAGSDILAGYRAADVDDDDNDATANYYGFVDTDGNWYIMKEEISGSVSTYTFTRGTTNYSANWTGRAGLTYGSFDSTF